MGSHLTDTYCAGCLEFTQILYQSFLFTYRGFSMKKVSGGVCPVYGLEYLCRCHTLPVEMLNAMGPTTSHTSSHNVTYIRLPQAGLWYRLTARSVEKGMPTCRRLAAAVLLLGAE